MGSPRRRQTSLPTFISAPNRQCDVLRGMPERSDIRNGSIYSSGISVNSDKSMEAPLRFSKSHVTAMLEDCLKCSVCENILKEPVFIPCGDTFCKTCIQNHLKEDCCCPKCKKRFETCPDLPLNKTLDHLLKQMGFSPALPAHSYAGPDDLTCDICTGGKIKAVKLCLTCRVSYCETHVRNHYTEEALNQHEVVDATKDLKQKIYQQNYKNAGRVHSAGT